MKFIHCADIHLGKYQNAEEDRYEDFFNAFDNIVNEAVERKVDYVVCAGDLFDLKAINAATLLKTADILKKLKENKIKFIVTDGNHDRNYYYEKCSWLDYLKTSGLAIFLKPKKNENGEDDYSSAVYEEEDICFIGLSYSGLNSEKRIKSFCEKYEKSSKYTVILLHASLIDLMIEDMAGVSKDALLMLGEKCDYIALGHIHKRYCFEKAYNPGSCEFVNADEAKRGDEKGFYLVDTQKGNVDFIRNKTRSFAFYDLDAMGLGVEEAACAIAKFDMDKEAVCIINAKNVSFDILPVQKQVLELTGIRIQINCYLEETEETVETEETEDIEGKVLEEAFIEKGYNQKAVSKLKFLALKIKEEKPEASFILAGVKNVVEVCDED